MNTPYSAAEYFLEVIRKNSNFCINYHCINILIQQAPKEVAKFFKTEGQNDPLYVFKKFPDIFILNEDTVTLTDAFLTLFAFPLSSEFCSNKASETIFETAVIEFFKLLLIRCGRCHFTSLFTVLLKQNGLDLTKYYSHYTETDKYNFFLKHVDSFSVSGQTVYLNIYSPLCLKTVDTGENSEAIKKLTKATYFLLTYFESLHYLELKQIISFVLGIVRDYLNSHSLTQQREIFENIPDTTFDEKGYLSLNNFDAPHPRSRKVRLITLIVCILAFERQMHFEKLAQQVKKRVSSDVNSSLCDISISDQFHFFRSYTDYFIISIDGHVTLLPSFIFPLCLFENVALSTHTDVSLLKLDNSVGVNLPHSSTRTNLNNLCKNNWNDFNGSSQKLALNRTLKICDISTTFNLENVSDNRNDGAIKQLISPLSLSLRLKLSVIYLCSCFISPSCESILGSSLFVLNDVFVNFKNLSYVEQQRFVQEYCDFFEKVSKAELTTVPSMNCFWNKEKVLLFIVYALIKQKRMHFETLASWINFSKIDNTFSSFSVQNQLLYFSEMTDYINISANGFINLNKTFNVVSSTIPPHFKATSSNSLPLERSGSPLLDKGLKVSVLPAVHNSKITSPSEVCGSHQLHVPQNIWTKLQLSLIHLSNFFDRLLAIPFLAAVLHSLKDVKSYFLSLSAGHQQTFIDIYFKNIGKDCVFEITLEPSEMSNEFSMEEKTLITITFMLIEVKSAHYEKIIKKLKALNIGSSLFKGNAKALFKKFKELNEYFIIEGTGSVCLSSSFYSISSTLNSVSALIPEHSNKLKKNIKIRYPEGRVNGAVGGTKKQSQNEVVNQVTNGICKEIKKGHDDSISLPHPLSLNLQDLIVDLSVCMLSGSIKKMKIESLCQRLNASTVKSIQNYFSYQTLTEKKKFFLCNHEYFKVSEDDFISLRNDVVTSYTPKTSLITQHPKGHFILNPNSDLINYKGPDFVVTGSSKVSTSSNTSVISINRPRGKRGKKGKKSPTPKISTNVDSKKIPAYNYVKTTTDFGGSSAVTKNCTINSNSLKTSNQIKHDSVFTTQQNTKPTAPKVSWTYSVHKPSSFLPPFLNSQTISQSSAQVENNQNKPHVSTEKNVTLSEESQTRAMPLSCSLLPHSSRTISLSSALTNNATKLTKLRQPHQKPVTSHAVCDNSKNYYLSALPNKSFTIHNSAKILVNSNSRSEDCDDHMNDKDLIAYGLELLDFFLDDPVWDSDI